MLVNGANDWTVEQVFSGERLYNITASQVTWRIDYVLNEGKHDFQRLSKHEITGIVAHALLEVAMRRIMAARMSCTLAEFEAAARYVYRSCHAIEEQGGAQISQ